MMSPWFPGDGFPKQSLQIFLPAPVSKGGVHVHLIVGKKAWTKLAVSREPESVAPLAEDVAKSANESNFVLG